MELLVVGHSHTTSLAHAATAMGVKCEVVRLGAETELTQLRTDVAVAVSALKGSSVKQADISRAIADSDIRSIVTVGGNFHNVVGMLKHSQPYDFCVLELDQLPLASDHQVIQYDVMCDFFYTHLRRMFLTILDVKRLLGDRMVHIDSPPPLHDNQFIHENIDEYFKNLFLERMPDINEPAIRLKHWQLSKNLYKKFCREADIKYLENKLPRHKKYYLPKIYFGGDATHANAEFAKDYIRSVAEMKGLNYGPKHTV